MNAVIDLHQIVPAWQALQSAAPILHIESDADLRELRESGRLSEVLREYRR